MDTAFYPLVTAIVGWIVGVGMEENGKDNHKPGLETLGKAIKWISIVIVCAYALFIVAIFTDGIGDIPLIGGMIWVRGHWRRKG